MFARVSLSLSQEDLSTRHDDFEDRIDADAQVVASENTQSLYDAKNHATDLEYKAEEFERALIQYKTPGARSLEAASAYEKITSAVNKAREAGQEGLVAANDAQSMVSSSTGVEWGIEEI